MNENKESENITKQQKTREVLDRLEKVGRESSEGEFNYEVLSGSISNYEFDLIIEHIESQIKFVESHADSKRRFEITKQLFKKIMVDEFMPAYELEFLDRRFETAKKISQGTKAIFNDVEKLRNSLDVEAEINALCKLYAFQYERACNSYFKPIASLITQKKIQRCSECIKYILKYYPNFEFVLQPFIPRIRNSISHIDYYYDHQTKHVVFNDDEKIPIKVTLDELRTFCTLQMVSDVCISTAEHAMKLSVYKTSQYYFKKTEEYCRILGLDFKMLIIECISKGYNLLTLHNILERILNKKNTR